jgi:hypothetical protein
MVATASVSAYPRVRIALSAMRAAREVRSIRWFDIAKHDMICMVGREVDGVMSLLSEKLSNLDAIKGLIWDGLHKTDQQALSGRGIVLMSHLTHPNFHEGPYVIGKKMDGEWFALYYDPKIRGDDKTRCRIDDSTVMLMVVPGSFDAIKLFVEACRDAVDQLFIKKLKRLRAARKKCALGWIAESFDLSLWPQATDHIRTLRSRK